MMSVSFTISKAAARALEDYYYDTKVRGRPIHRAPGSKDMDDPVTMLTSDRDFAQLMKQVKPGERIDDAIFRLVSAPR